MITVDRYFGIGFEGGCMYRFVVVIRVATEAIPNRSVTMVTLMVPELCVLPGNYGPPICSRFTFAHPSRPLFFSKGVEEMELYVRLLSLPCWLACIVPLKEESPPPKKNQPVSKTFKMPKTCVSLTKNLMYRYLSIYVAWVCKNKDPTSCVDASECFGPFTFMPRHFPSINKFHYLFQADALPKKKRNNSPVNWNGRTPSVISSILFHNKKFYVQNQFIIYFFLYCTSSAILIFPIKPKMIDGYGRNQFPLWKIVENYKRNCYMHWNM